MDGGAIDEPSMAKRPGSGSVTTRTGLGWIRNAHAGYISWERFEENLHIPRRMVRDMRWRVYRLREKVRRCGKDGQYAGYAVKHFRIRDTARRGRLDAWDVRDRAHGYRGEPQVSVHRRASDRAGHRTLIAEQMMLIRRLSSWRSRSVVAKDRGPAPGRDWRHYLLLSNGPKSKDIFCPALFHVRLRSVQSSRRPHARR